MAIERMRGQDMQGAPYWIGQKSTTRNGQESNPPVARPTLMVSDFLSAADYGLRDADNSLANQLPLPSCPFAAAFRESACNSSRLARAIEGVLPVHLLVMMLSKKLINALHIKTDVRIKTPRPAVELLGTEVVI